MTQKKTKVFGSLSRSFGTDESLENDGVWIDLDDGIRIRVRRMQGDYVKESLRRWRKSHRQHLKPDGTLPEKIEEELLVRALSELILADWDGVDDEDGKPIKFSPDVARVAFEQFSDFMERVAFHSRQTDNFIAEDRREMAKNSDGASAST